MGKVLVTGGAGFIGSHVVESLVASGEEPVALDNLASATGRICLRCNAGGDGRRRPRSGRGRRRATARGRDPRRRAGERGRFHA